MGAEGPRQGKAQDQQAAEISPFPLSHGGADGEFDFHYSVFVAHKSHNLTTLFPLHSLIIHTYRYLTV